MLEEQLKLEKIDHCKLVGASPKKVSQFTHLKLYQPQITSKVNTHVHQKCDSAFRDDNSIPAVWLLSPTLTRRENPQEIPEQPRALTLPQTSSENFSDFESLQSSASQNCSYLPYDNQPGPSSVKSSDFGVNFPESPKRPCSIPEWVKVKDKDEFNRLCEVFCATEEQANAMKELRRKGINREAAYKSRVKWQAELDGLKNTHKILNEEVKRVQALLAAIKEAACLDSEGLAIIGYQESLNRGGALTKNLPIKISIAEADSTKDSTEFERNRYITRNYSVKSSCLQEKNWNNDHVISDSDLIKLSTKQLNKLVKRRGISKEEQSIMKSRRRTLKNRGYAAKLKRKRETVKARYESEIGEFRKQLNEVRAQIENLDASTLTCDETLVRSIEELKASMKKPLEARFSAPPYDACPPQKHSNPRIITHTCHTNISNVIII